MRITDRKLKQITFGSVESVYEDGGITFYKCTKRQRNAWMTRSQELYERACTSTGIRLDFHTNSSTLSFRALSGRKFDILINGRLAMNIQGDFFDENGVCKNISLPDGDKRITVIFPSHEKTTLEYVELSDESYYIPYRYSHRILFMGDSITQGWNSKYDSMSFAWQCALHLNADCVINGVGGAYFEEDTFDVSDFDPDVVVVAYGTNDFSVYTSYEQLRDYASCFLDRVKAAYADKYVIGISPIWRSDCDKPKKIGDFKGCCQVVKEEIKAHGFHLLDGDDIVPHFDDFYADAIHPNDLGFCKYAEALVSKIEKKL